MTSDHEIEVSVLEFDSEEEKNRILKIIENHQGSGLNVREILLQDILLALSNEFRMTDAKMEEGKKYLHDFYKRFMDVKEFPYDPSCIGGNFQKLVDGAFGSIVLTPPETEGEDLKETLLAFTKCYLLIRSFTMLSMGTMMINSVSGNRRAISHWLFAAFEEGMIQATKLADKHHKKKAAEDAVRSGQQEDRSNPDDSQGS